MNNPKEIVKDVSKQLVANMIKHDMTGWPPDCLLFAYQQSVRLRTPTSTILISLPKSNTHRTHFASLLSHRLKHN